MQSNQNQKREYLLNILQKVPKSEQQLQSKCAELLYWFYPDHWKRLVCVYNNSLRANTQGFGQVPGASDMYWLDYGRVKFIEFKFGATIDRPKKSLQSDVQKEWQSICVDLGHFYYLCYNEHTFWQIIGFNQPCEADIAFLKWFA